MESKAKTRSSLSVSNSRATARLEINRACTDQAWLSEIVEQQEVRLKKGVKLLPGGRTTHCALKFPLNLP